MTKILTFALLLMTLPTSFQVAFGQKKECLNLAEKESIEISYLVDCLKKSNVPTELLAWKQTCQYDTMVCFDYKSRLVFFNLSRKIDGTLLLHSISYYRSSFHVDLFESELPSSISITTKAKYLTYSSKDGCSHYFVIHASDQLYIWVLSAHKDIYRRVVALSD